MHQLHHEEWTSLSSDSGVQHTCNVGMVHQRQCLPLGLESSHNLFGVHAGLDDFQGNFAANGFRLLGHVDDSKTSFAELLSKFIGTDLLGFVPIRCHADRRLESGDWLIKKAVVTFPGRQQRFDSPTQRHIITAHFRQVVVSAVSVLNPSRRHKDFLLIHL